MAALLGEVDPVSRSVIDAHFRNTVKVLYIAHVACRQTFHANDDPCSGNRIFKRFEPYSKFFGLNYRVHA